MNATRMPALCQGCGAQGPMRSLEDVKASGIGKEPWCKCPPKKLGGPYVAPPGFVARFTFESKEEHEFRERCRLAGNAERAAKDAMVGRYVKCGRGSRRLPDSHPRVRALLSNWRKAARVLERLQAECSHPERSLFNRIMCGVCYAQVECDVEHYRHLVREIGVRATARLAV